MKIDYIHDQQIVLVRFDDTARLARSFVRMQEHYENPAFRGTVFTLGQFRQWYTQQFGGFSYYGDWTGFNVPNTAIRPFLDGLFDPLTPEEIDLLDVVRHKQGDYYMIGTDVAGDSFLHEMCHAMYYLNSGYRQLVDTILSPEMLPRLRDHLLQIGYSEYVLRDEMNAYLVTEKEYLKEQGIKLPTKLRQRLLHVARHYVGDMSSYSNIFG